jgi:tetrahydromethanopterin S-methyltransferase subunit G
LSTGCIAQQSDLKQTEKNLQLRIKQSSDESAQTRARQSQEISVLREQELPQLRGELERALHQAQELQGKQEDLKQRASQIEQQTKKLEQLAGKIETESSTRYAWIQKSLDTQDLKSKEDRERFRTEMNTRLDDVNKQVETLRKELIEAVQKTNSALMKSMDARLEEQRKTATALSERLAQEEQANIALSTKVESDIKASTTYINEMNKAVTGHLGEVNKSVTSVAQKFATRFEEQDRRLDTLSKAVDHVAQDARVRGGNKAGARQSTTKPAHRSALEPSSDVTKVEQ